jgi:putative ABC transport system substrate-binding protein
VNRRVFVTSFTVLAALSPTANPQQTAPRRIGVLMAPQPEFDEGIRQGLRDLGYIEGQNIVIEWRRSLSSDVQLEALAKELVDLKVELIIAPSTPPARAALRATSLPVVFASGDPVRSGLVTSLARPGGNGTGISSTTPELTAKRLELLQQLVPGMRRVLYLQNPSNPLSPQLLQEAKGAGGRLGLQIESLPARNVTELETALTAMKRARDDAVLVAGDLLFLSNRSKLVPAIRQTKLPAVYVWKDYHDQGVLVSYGPDAGWITRRLAVYVDKILKGGKPGELPIEQVIKYELVINLRVARELGIIIPDSILLRADEVIR